MPQDWKTSTNNLVIVWQGSSWSVIAPDGHVLFRHWSKYGAIEWAEQCFDYASDEYRPYVYIENPESEKVDISFSRSSTSYETSGSKPRIERKTTGSKSNSLNKKFAVRRSLQKALHDVLRNFIIVPLYHVSQFAFKGGLLLGIGHLCLSSLGMGGVPIPTVVFNLFLWLVVAYTLKQFFKHLLEGK